MIILVRDVRSDLPCLHMARCGLWMLGGLRRALQDL